jgi:hypothetical protein
MLVHSLYKQHVGPQASFLYIVIFDVGIDGGFIWLTALRH